MISELIYIVQSSHSMYRLSNNIFKYLLKRFRIVKGTAIEAIEVKSSSIKNSIKIYYNRKPFTKNNMKLEQ